MTVFQTAQERDASLSYNSQRVQLVIPEYGRHVHELIDRAKTIQDPEERKAMLVRTVYLMHQVNPQSQKIEDSFEQLWQAVFVIGGKDLQVDVEYKPVETATETRPERMSYSQNKIKYRHYGKGVEMMIEEACKIEDQEKRFGYTHAIAAFMKMAHKAWAKEHVEDVQIVADLKELSNGKLTLEADTEIHAPSNLPNQRNQKDGFKKKKRNNKNRNKNNRNRNRNNRNR